MTPEEWEHSAEFDRAWRESQKKKDVRVTDISWDPEPPFKLETIDLLALTPDEIIPVALRLRSALREMREVLHVAGAELAKAHQELRHKNDGRIAPARASGLHRPNQIRSRAANERTISERRSIN